MRLALLCGAVPQVGKKGATVRLGVGDWKIVTTGLVDSKLQIHCSDLPTCDYHNGLCFHAENPMTLLVEFTSKGSEQYISVYAEKIK